ncbi:hypothetical protein VTK56DRAFT_8819 [Thermocarpiscus australiensis]
MSHIEQQQFVPVSADEPAQNSVPAAAPATANRTNARKRAAPDNATASPRPGDKKRRIARSCDQCNSRNAKCSGFKPCQNCTAKGRTCTYDRPYTRGIAKTPPPPPDNGETRNWAQPYDERGREYRDRPWGLRACDYCRTHTVKRCSGKLPCDTCFSQRIPCTFKMRAHQRSSTPGSTEEISEQSFADTDSARPGPSIAPLQLGTRYAGEETPPLVFLHRAWRRIALTLARPGQAAGSDPTPDQLSLGHGDQSFDTSKPLTFPYALSKWWQMEEKFRIGWTETFHFVHRLTVRSWIDTMFKNWSTGAPLERDIGPAKATIALMSMALGTMFYNWPWQEAKRDKVWNWLWTLNMGDQLFLMTLRLTDSEPGPPTLESVQARLLQTLYLLCTCRLGQAWYIFANVVGMITATGLNRRRGRNRGLGPEITVNAEYAKIQCERRTFWSAYVLDRQIALLSGRPCYFSSDTVDQDFPDCVNDEDMSRSGPFRPHQGDCYMEALVEQAKLSKIIEKVMREVYTLDDTPEDVRLERALRLAKDVDDWKAQLPFLMGHLKLSMLHPTFRRQATLLQLAHFHAQILLYRPFITATYPWDREKRHIADVSIRTCLEAAHAALCITINLAREQAKRDKSHFHTILYAHHVTFCATSVLLLVPHIRERQKLFGGSNYRKPTMDGRFFDVAEKAIKALRESTNKYSPARKWAIVLEELRDEAARQVPKEHHDKGHDTEGSGGNDRETEPDPAADDDDDDDDDNDDENVASPNEQLLEDALRAHWEANLARHATSDGNNETADEVAPAVTPRLWDKWRTTDWLDLDAAAFGPISAFQRGEVPIAPPQS